MEITAKQIARRQKQIQAYVSVHDRSQAEVRVNYNLIDLEEPPTKKSKKKKKKKKKSSPYKGSLSVFMLFPNQWGVNEKVYPVNDFLNDVRQYIRFREPYISFSFVLRDKDSRSNPYKNLIDILLKLHEKHTRGDITIAVQHIRSFGAGYSAYISKRIAKKLNRLESLMQRGDFLVDEKIQSKIQKCLLSLEQIIRRGYLVIRNWRKMIFEIVGDSPPEYMNDITREFRAVDEYCSALLLDHLALIKSELTHQDFDELKVKDPGIFRKINWTLNSHLRLENIYHRKSAYISVITASDVLEQEFAMTRMQALKRRIWSSLFLSSNSRKKIYWTREFGFSMAAAVAQTWVFVSTVVVLLYYPHLQLGGGRAWGAALLGVNGLLALGVFVLAYVVKDRIKEMGRSMFKKKDEDAEIVYKDISFSSPDEKEHDIATITETTNYMRVDTVPQSVQAMFHKHAIDLGLRIGGERKVLSMKREIDIKSQSIQIAETNSTAICEIIRFNLDRFQGIMGNPKKQGFVFNDEGEVQSLRIPKVYYLDMVINLSFVDQAKNPISKAIYSRFVINKKGLVRCDILDSLK